MFAHACACLGYHKNMGGLLSGTERPVHRVGLCCTGFFGWSAGLAEMWTGSKEVVCIWRRTLSVPALHERRRRAAAQKTQSWHRYGSQGHGQAAVQLEEHRPHGGEQVALGLAAVLLLRAPYLRAAKLSGAVQE